MMTLTRQLLILTASILLALPPGWCCILAPDAGVSAARLVVAEGASPCSHCCAKLAPQQDEEQPPSRTPITVCCCAQNLPLATRAVDFGADAGAAVLPELVHLVAGPSATSDSTTLTGPPFPSCALHVLQCVWLC